MTRVLLLTALALLSSHALPQPVVYYCNIITQLPGAPESPIFRFEVEDARASLTYTYRARASEAPQNFKLQLDVLNDSERSLVLGSLTEGDEEHAPRYDVWVLDKHNMQLSSEVTRASDTNIGRLEQRSGHCIVND